MGKIFFDMTSSISTSPFRLTLLKVSYVLTKENVQDLAFLCEDIPLAKRELITNGRELFAALQSHDQLNKQNVNVLIDWLDELRLLEASNLLKSYRETHLTVASTAVSPHDHHIQKSTIASQRDTLSHASTIQGLEVASANQIPIPIVGLFECSPRADESGLKLILQSGLSLSILSSLQKLMIHDVDRRLTNEEWSAILSYSAQCTSLKLLMFVDYDLPDTFPVGSIPLSLRARNVKVCIMRSFFTRRLDLQTGVWQASDIGGILPGEEGLDEESYQRGLERFNIMIAASSSGGANH